MRTLLLFLILAAIACAGCSVSPEERLVGVWVPDQELTVLPPIPIPSLEKRAKSLMGRFVLKLRSDKTFVIGSGVAVEGKWSLAGDTITLTPDKGEIAGALGDIMPAMKTMEVKIKPDYSRLTLEQPTPLGAVVVVLRKSA